MRGNASGRAFAALGGLRFAVKTRASETPLLECPVRPKIEPTFGLTGASYRVLLRFGMQYEIKGLGRKIAKLLH